MIISEKVGLYHPSHIKGNMYGKYKEYFKKEDLIELYPIDKQFDLSELNIVADLLDKTFKVRDVDNPMEYVVAGGYCRDKFSGNQFNDIDIYVISKRDWHDEKKLEIWKDDAYLTWRDNEKFANKLAQAGDVNLLLKSNHKFFNTIIIIDNRPFKVQIMFNWFANLPQILNSFDFQHCQFCIPLNSRELQNNIIYGTKEGFDCELEQVIGFAQGGEKRLMTFAPDNLYKMMKRLNKFYSRNYKLPQDNKQKILSWIDYTNKHDYQEVVKDLLINEDAYKHYPDNSYVVKKTIEQVLDESLEIWLKTFGKDDIMVLASSPNRSIGESAKRVFNKMFKE